MIAYNNKKISLLLVNKVKIDIIQNLFTYFNFDKNDDEINEKMKTILSHIQCNNEDMKKYIKSWADTYIKLHKISNQSLNDILPQDINNSTPNKNYCYNDDTNSNTISSLTNVSYQNELLEQNEFLEKFGKI